MTSAILFIVSHFQQGIGHFSKANGSFWRESLSPPWATLGQRFTNVTPVQWQKMARFEKNRQFWPQKITTLKNFFFVDCAPGHVSSYCFVGMVFSALIYFQRFFFLQQAVNLDFTACQMGSVNQNIDFLKSPLVTAVHHFPHQHYFI